MWFYWLAGILGFGALILINAIRIQRVKRRAKLSEEINNLHQQALTSQMNPHFLFNSLNSIQNYVLKNDRLKSNQYLSQFAKLKRAVLESSRRDLITLEEELENLELYIGLEKLRFSGEFNHRISTENIVSLTDFLIPPLIIQPMVENAIRHGLIHKEDEGNPSIEINRSQSVLKIYIIDDGVGLSYNPKGRDGHRSHGTDIILKRIELLQTKYHSRTSFKIIDLMDGDRPAGTKVELILPVISKTNAESHNN